MFTGIIECIAEIRSLHDEGSNRIFEIFAPLQEAVHVDQSIAHDGVCLTLTAITQELAGQGVAYTVTAIRETLNKTQLGSWEVGTKVNLERAMKVGARLDGHFVQGHVDRVAEVHEVIDQNGSWDFTFRIPKEKGNLLVNKGSVCINGVSLTVVRAWDEFFSVSIIPYTFEHTNFHTLKAGAQVNIEFDILGKYIAKLQAK